MQRTAQRTSSYGESHADFLTWGGNILAIIVAGCGIAAGAIGMLMAFGYINEDSTAPFNDGITWLLGGLVVTIVANVFRREHHVVDEYTRTEANQKADDMDMFIGNTLAIVLGGLAVACAVIGLLVNFEYIKEGNVNPFEDALIWFSAGSILAFAALIFRREPHVREDSVNETRTVRHVAQDSGDVHSSSTPESTRRNF